MGTGHRRVDAAGAAQLVRIGAAHPPYTVRPEQGADTGLLPQLVEALNAAQTDYQFVVVPTSIPDVFATSSKAGSTWRSSKTRPGVGRILPIPVLIWGSKMRKFLSLSVSPGATRVIF